MPSHRWTLIFGSISDQHNKMLALISSKQGDLVNIHQKMQIHDKGGVFQLYNSMSNSKLHLQLLECMLRLMNIRLQLSNLYAF